MEKNWTTHIAYVCEARCLCYLSPATKALVVVVDHIKTHYPLLEIRPCRAVATEGTSVYIPPKISLPKKVIVHLLWPTTDSTWHTYVHVWDTNISFGIAMKTQTYICEYACFGQTWLTVHVVHKYGFLNINVATVCDMCSNCHVVGDRHGNRVCWRCQSKPGGNGFRPPKQPLSDLRPRFHGHDVFRHCMCVRYDTW